MGFVAISDNKTNDDYLLVWRNTFLSPFDDGDPNFHSLLFAFTFYIFLTKTQKIEAKQSNVEMERCSSPWFVVGFSVINTSLCGL